MERLHTLSTKVEAPVNHITRRGFLKRAGIVTAVAGLGLALNAPPVRADGPNWSDPRVWDELWRRLNNIGDYIGGIFGGQANPQGVTEGEPGIIRTDTLENGIKIDWRSNPGDNEDLFLVPGAFAGLTTEMTLEAGAAGLGGAAILPEVVAVAAIAGMVIYTIDRNPWIYEGVERGIGGVINKIRGYDTSHIYEGYRAPDRQKAMTDLYLETHMEGGPPHKPDWCITRIINGVRTVMLLWDLLPGNMVGLYIWNMTNEVQSTAWIQNERDLLPKGFLQRLDMDSIDCRGAYDAFLRCAQQLINEGGLPFRPA